MVGVHVAVLLHPATGFAKLLVVHVVHQPYDIVLEGALHIRGAERCGAIQLFGQTIFALLVWLGHCVSHQCRQFRNFFLVDCGHVK